MKLGHKALIAGENEKALQIFNALLNLPPNKQSQGAQEWIGVARQRSGESAKAKAEYELYLKLYPEGEGAIRTQTAVGGVAGGHHSACANQTKQRHQED